MLDKLRSLFARPKPSVETTPAASTAVAGQNAKPVPGPYIAGLWKVEHCTALPCALNIGSKFYRYQDLKHFHKDHDFWKTFEDGPWKWKTKYRFAGENLNTGHFFGLNEEGIKAEAEHYGSDFSGKGVLCIDAHFEKILDLTTPEGLQLAFDSVVTNHNEFGSTALILEELINVDTGGTKLTDDVGQWAISQGYTGILFIGARRIRFDFGGNDPWHNRNLVGYNLLDYRAQPSHMNLVIFRGGDVVSATETYEIAGHCAKTQNIYHGTPSDDIYKLSQFDIEYQRKQMKPSQNA